MKTINASEFKAKCLAIMDEVAKTGEEIIITKHGTAVSKIVPYTNRPESLFGMHRNRIKAIGDILAPIDEEWDACR